MQYIYSRVSTERQKAENQTLNLKAKYPDAVVFEETASGAKVRPVLETLIGHVLKPGDSLIVAALDRLGRRTSEVLALIEDLSRRGITLISVREGVDYSTITGKLVTQILCSVAEMERNLISERTRDALAAKKAQGVKLGARPKIPAETVARVRELRREGRKFQEIADLTGVSLGRVHTLCKTG